MDRVAQRDIVRRAFFVGTFLLASALSAQAQQEFSPASVKKGVLLVASPSLSDPNFHQTVLLIIEHGRGGTVGLILNRPTNVLLSEVLPDFTVLKRTPYRLFAGGPVNQTQLVLLFRLTRVLPDTRQIVGEIHIGTPGVMERIITQPKPTETFRAFIGFAGWAPGQLEHEMIEGAWGILPSDALSIFDKDPATLWPDSITRLQAPKTISH